MNTIDAINKTYGNLERAKKKTEEKEKEKEKTNFIMNKNNILEYYFNLPIKNKKAYIKIVDEDLIVPRFKDYNNLLLHNYSVSQLKLLSKHYKLASSGNKDYLKKRLYNYLYFTYNIINIQKMVRTYIFKKYIRLHGEAFFKRGLCCNDIDFCTLDDLNKIPYNQFISIKDTNNHIYGYDILSLYNLFMKVKNYNSNTSNTSNTNNSNSNSNSNNIHSNINSNIILTNVQNPFTNIFFSYKILIQLLEYIRLSNLLKISVNLNYEELANLSIAKQLEMKILTLFQRMDSLGNYTNISWFNHLDKYGLILFIRELADIWNYRASLSQEIKREIVPPLGNPFYNGDINVTNLTQYNFIQIKKYSIFIIDLMVNKGINENSCSLGSYYVLCALTLVSREAAEALPWLYEAVNYQ